LWVPPDSSSFHPATKTVFFFRFYYQIGTNSPLPNSRLKWLGDGSIEQDVRLSVKAPGKALLTRPFSQVFQTGTRKGCLEGVFFFWLLFFFTQKEK